MTNFLILDKVMWLYGEVKSCYNYLSFNSLSANLQSIIYCPLPFVLLPYLPYLPLTFPFYFPFLPVPQLPISRFPSQSSHFPTNLPPPYFSSYLAVSFPSYPLPFLPPSNLSSFPTLPFFFDVTIPLFFYFFLPLFLSFPSSLFPLFFSLFLPSPFSIPFLFRFSVLFPFPLNFPSPTLGSLISFPPRRGGGGWGELNYIHT